MKLSKAVLGSSAVESLMKRESQAILVLGKDVFTRGDLSGVKCWNFVAAQSLSAILNRELDVKSTRDVFDRIPPTALAIPRIGAIALAVLSAAFEAKGIGGERPLEAWVEKHRKDENDLMVTFVSLKRRDAKHTEIINAEKKKRKAARRDQAHRVRVGRFEMRQQRTGVSA